MSKSVVATFPREMLDLAMGTLKPELQKLRKDGVEFAERVLFVADAAVEPGKTLWIQNMSRLPGGTVARATADWSKFVELSRAKGKPFYISDMLRPDNVMPIVDAMAGHGSWIGNFRERLTGPLPKDQFRIVLVREGEAHLYFVNVTPQCDVSYVPKERGRAN
jgi:hypothetical protein